MTTTEEITTVISTEGTTTIEMTTFPIVIAEQVAANGPVKEDVVISNLKLSRWCRECCSSSK